MRRTLTTPALVFVMFFAVSGGAYSIEELVHGVGPGMAILMLVILPIVYSLPETLIVGELASMIPEEGGYYRWVTRAFGEFWGFMNGWTTWLYSLVDMALYPVLFNLYLRWFFPGLSTGVQWAVSLGVIWTCTAINLMGAKGVGRVSTWAAVFILAGFTALAVVALPQATHAPWVPFAVSGTTVESGLAVGLSIALWNYIGWDNASTLQGEVVDASRSYPRALLLTLPLVILSYFVPLLPALAASDWTTWTEGSWPQIAIAVGGKAGPVIAVWLAFGGLLSAVGLFNSLMAGNSRVPLAMAFDGLLPRRLAATDARGTPVNAVLLSSFCYSVFAMLPFSRLVVADVMLYSAALLMEMAALVQLRRREPGLRGAFRIPLGTKGVAVLVMFPAMVLITVVWLSFGDEGAAASLWAVLIGVALGPLAYRAVKRMA